MSANLASAENLAARVGHKSAARIVHILERLRRSPEGCYCADLAAEVGVSLRTISRYVGAIRLGLRTAESGMRLIQYQDGEGTVLQLLPDDHPTPIRD